jgi:imidazole glycerol-phosphate synthase subunit HisF
VDFYCAGLKLAIEIEGGIHLQFDVRENDIQRQESIEGLGIRFLRFNNGDVYDNLDRVVQTIRDTIRILRSDKHDSTQYCKLLESNAEYRS